MSINHDEISVIKKWSMDVEKRIGKSVFTSKFRQAYSVEEFNLFIGVFDIEAENIPAREVKRIIREEADKYKDGRLYFMAYNDKERIMILLLYSFFLDEITGEEIIKLDPKTS